MGWGKVYLDLILDHHEEIWKVRTPPDSSVDDHNRLIAEIDLLWPKLTEAERRAGLQLQVTLYEKRLGQKLL
ncbi:hypothetical protein AYO40_01125 [Planctomycetaceae bacterium SCGC AG-212-D15]|nr:hypothetical protein AYO40_01125 [Planctomycetaceae bacterium SCGC AG-212-D15]